MSEALVLFSGGQDSTICLFWAKKMFSKVRTVSFEYGQRHWEQEKAAQDIISKSAEVEKHFLPIYAFQLIGGSALTGEGEVSDSWRGLPASFVPGRNAVMLSLAASLAYTLKINNLVGGMCETDYSGYPDCRREFIDAMEEALSFGLQYRINIYTPLMRLTKAESIKLAMTFPQCYEALAHSHTCYEGVRPPCGECPACKLRAKGFKEAGVKDPIYD
uniref:7-cyano-7-deazaguanine synthase n=1 Tax=viral metagenome TaxID=1070528 RepID=A0A6M3IPZ0_9ZZZZ